MMNKDFINSTVPYFKTAHVCWLFEALPGESKKRPAFDRSLLLEYICNDILQYLIE